MGEPDQGSAAAEEARRALGGAAGRGRGGRFSVGRKRAVVLRLLRGEDHLRRVVLRRFVFHFLVAVKSLRPQESHPGVIPDYPGLSRIKTLGHA